MISPDGYPFFGSPRVRRHLCRADARAPRHDRVRDAAGDRHLYRSGLYFSGGSARQPGSRLDAGSDGLGFLGVWLGVRAVRDSRRLARRSSWTPPRADADRDLVVVLHGRHRLGLELRVASRDADAVWHGGSRLFPQPDPDLYHLAATA